MKLNELLFLRAEAMRNSGKARPHAKVRQGDDQDSTQPRFPVLAKDAQHHALFALAPGQQVLLVGRCVESESFLASVQGDPRTHVGSLSMIHSFDDELPPGTVEFD